MAIIYTYPEKTSPVAADLLLMSDSADGNKTVQAKISSIKDTLDVVDSIVAGSGIDISSATGTVTITNAGVRSLASANSAIVASSSTGTVTITSTAYAGGANIGHVPTGGTNTTFLRGDGTWVIPTNTTYGAATSTEIGLLKLGSDTTLTAAYETGTPGTGVENRVYPVQFNSSNQAGVYVPWTDSGGSTYTAGNGLTLSGTEFRADLLSNGGLIFSGGNNQLGVDLSATAMAGTLAVTKGGTGINNITQGALLRGNGTSALAADSYLTYESSSKSLRVRGIGNSVPSLSCTLAINDAQGPTSAKNACIGLTPVSQSQGAKGIHIDLGAYNEGIQIYRNNGLANVAVRFHQTVSGTTDIGSITMTNSATSYNTSSDYRLKENVTDMIGAVDRIKQLLPKRFNFISEPNKIVDGFLAHEAQAIVPESVTGTKDEVDADGNAVYQGIDQAKLVPLLVGAIKELTARIEALEA